MIGAPCRLVMAAVVLAQAAAPQSNPGTSAGRQRFDAFQAAMRAGTLHVYPASAEARNLPGLAVLECAVDAEGWLENCTVVSEAPAGEGFGEAAMKLVPGFRKPADSGTKIQLPIDFRAAPPELPE